MATKVLPHLRPVVSRIHRNGSCQTVCWRIVDSAQAPASDVPLLGLSAFPRLDDGSGGNHCTYNQLQVVVSSAMSCLCLVERAKWLVERAKCRRHSAVAGELGPDFYHRRGSFSEQTITPCSWRATLASMVRRSPNRSGRHRSCWRKLALSWACVRQTDQHLR
jgi:hypothetical protein